MDKQTTTAAGTAGPGRPAASHRHVALLLPVLLLLFGGCAVGPDYLRPESGEPATWHSAPGRGLTAGSLDPALLAGWWTTLEDPVLTSLIEQAVRGSLDLKQAMARVNEARARHGLSRAEQWPAFSASGAATKSRSGGTTVDHFSLGFDAGWEIDLFGGLRRGAEAAQAELAASNEGLRDALVTLTAEVARNYIEVRTLQARLAVAEQNLTSQRQTFELIQWQFTAGLASELTMQQARANLESGEAQLPSLRSGLDAAKNRVAVLTGSTPGGLHALLAEPGPGPVPPLSLAVGVPAEALRQRPDIRRAERTLAAQTARVGVATAELYPKLRLGGSIGLESLKAADLFRSGSETWSFGPSLSWNLFDFGRVRRSIQVQSALQEQALLAYESAVLAALEEVENALTAYGEEQLRHERLLAAVDAAQRAETLARDQYRAGVSDFLTVLDAQRTRLSLEDQLAASSGTVSANLVRLYKAMGGGWQNLAPLQSTPAPATQDNHHE